ncbi:MAG: VWA domain-containing protein [Proteobacteria bacterium]|nr:VWA domain-containing protein [Pseudomonadota bacterium]MBU1716576.1 VWA domain-containing protein [Pseudomonadota bacterium]
MIFATPWALLGLLIIPFIVYLLLRRKQHASLRFSSTRLPAAAGRSWRQKMIHLPLFLRVLTLILLTLALARPQAGMEKVYDVSKGIAIEMVVDRSSSMSEEMEFGSRQLNRLEVVKEVFKEFVRGNQDLSGRNNDLIGMISFARYADTICPLTLAHGALDGFLDNVKLVDLKSEDGTAIGDALMLATARLKTAEESLSKQAHGPENKERNYEIKSKIIILLTDGMNNRGENKPEEAAALAKEWGIKIYTIGVGSEKSSMNIPGFFGLQAPSLPSIDKAMLGKLAENTGGIFRMAEDAKALRAIYQEIDQLEKSEVTSVRYIDYKELFSRFALTALALLALEIILRRTIFRKIP